MQPSFFGSCIFLFLKMQGLFFKPVLFPEFIFKRNVQLDVGQKLLDLCSKGRSLTFC
jgi:hypothetical protein